MYQSRSEARKPINYDSNLEEIAIVGVEGSYSWVIRIGSFVIFVATLVVNYLVGVQNGAISDQYHLYVTPPGWFFSIWAVIYTTLSIVNIVNLFKNQWSKQTHLFFTFSNILNSLWIVIFNIATNTAVYACSLILILSVPVILKTWFALGDRPRKSFTCWTYITRNVFAFYLGWVIAAANLNLGLDIVYWWGATKVTQLVIFWVMAPLCAVGATAFNYVKEGRKGLLSCFALWLSVAWAFTGAAITSNGCLSGTFTRC